jgi:hypothetical protein
VFQTDKALCYFLWGTLLSHMSRGKILNSRELRGRGRARASFRPSEAYAIRNAPLGTRRRAMSRRRSAGT